jgi:thiol-disulfide isomerase/thioredoxin
MARHAIDLPPTADGRPVLFFLHAAGCGACDALKPYIASIWKKRQDIRVVPVDLTSVEWKARKWEPEGTPTLIVRYPDGRLSTPALGPDPDELATWLHKVLP